MGRFFETIPDFVVHQIETRHMVLVATEVHVDVSSKGLEGTFHVLGMDV